MLKKTALFDEHKKLNGRMVDFGGWELPVQYSGVMSEHVAVRTAAGLFDVSHMGEILIQGPDAESFLNYLVTNNVVSLSIHQAQYSAMCNEAGGIVDDLVIYRLAKNSFFLVVNASNTDKDFEHILSVKKTYLANNPQALFTIENQSPLYSQIAIQGPKSEEILQKLTLAPLHEIKTYWCFPSKILNIDTLIARTGYTGEDGFELYLPWSDAPIVWRSLIELGAPLGLLPSGLGARDTLRLEMKYALYGHELNDETTPLETGLNWVTKFDKKDFVGKNALSKIKAAGVKRTLVGLKSLNRSIPRQNYEVYAPDKTTKIGIITSGTSSPSLKEPIGIALIDKAFEAIGTHLWVKIRDEAHQFEVVKTPFFKHT